MGNSKSKKVTKEKVDVDKDTFFDREKRKQQKREDRKKIKSNPIFRRNAANEVPVVPGSGPPPLPPSGSAGPGPAPPAPALVRHYDEEAIERMRYQLHNDSDAFLLNNILLSVQFFEHFEREVHNIKNNPISDRETHINEAMLRRHKHVFFADRLQECVHEHVHYNRQRGQTEPLAAPRMYVIYDNVEASEPGDTSDYSAVLDAPFYKLCIEDCKEPGYVKLKKLEVLESTLNKENEDIQSDVHSDDVYTESEKESNDSDDVVYGSKREGLLHTIEAKFLKKQNTNNHLKIDYLNVNKDPVEVSGRRGSGPIKKVSLQVEKNHITNINNIKKSNGVLFEESEPTETFKTEDTEVRPRRSILKNARRTSGPIRELKNKLNADMQKIEENAMAEDTETSGYKSNSSSSRQNESSENESDYGYATITESSTPKKIELSLPSNYSVSSGVLPQECWSTVYVRSLENWSENEDDEFDDVASKSSLSRNLYDTFFYLGSTRFMNNFVDNFIINLGSGLGLSQEAIGNTLTQGASIYCDITKNGTKMSVEVFPALIASWPNAANQWIIRERRIIQNPRTNFSYQWPTRYMVSKVINFGCLLVPLGFRPKRRVNPEQVLQWRIIFPAAERYLESCLAHSHMRCYLFALALYKTFMEIEASKIGIDPSHLKNHLFWQCEDNYAKWPEDRLGETLRIFLRSFYVHIAQGRLPNYFIDTCNDFKSIPKPLLIKLQKRLADILERPVMHVLKALTKLKYAKKDFYPLFNISKLYEILTSKNPLRILNPNIPIQVQNPDDSSDSELDDSNTNIFDRLKLQDKNYQWKKERQRQIHERRKAQFNIKKQKINAKQEKEINTNILLPPKLDADRRRLVLDFFAFHFIAMARSSEKFEAIRQAVIYLEQAQRLCVLLKEEPGGDTAANEYFEVIRDKLADCQRKLVNQGGFKLPRRESQLDRMPQRPLRKTRPRFEQIVSQGQDSPTDAAGISAFTFVEVHAENSNHSNIKLNDVFAEESKL